MIKNIHRKMREGSHMPAINVEDSEEHVCLNCGTKYRGNFCPGCRQKASTHRLSLPDTLKNGFGRFTKIDNGFLHTIIHLLYRPGYMVRDYINGFRTEYVDPLLLLFIIIAIEHILPETVNDSLPTAMPENYNTLLASYPITLKICKFWFWLFGDIQRAFIWLASIIALAITGTQKIIRLKENKLNFSEAFHLVLYAICYAEFVGLIEKIVFLVFPSSSPWLDPIDDVLCIGFLIIFIVMIYQNISIKWWKFLLFLVTYPICFVFYFALLILSLQLYLSIALPKDLSHQIALMLVFANL